MSKQRTRSICAKQWEAKALHEGRLSLLLRPTKYTDENTRGCDPGMVLLSGNHATPIRDGVGLVWRPGAHDHREQPMPPEKIAEFCPFGSIDDELAFKEAWSLDHRDFYPNYPVVYKADGYPEPWIIEGGKIFSDELNDWFRFQWRSAATMPSHLIRSRRTISDARFVKPCDLTEDEARGTSAKEWYIATAGKSNGSYAGAKELALYHSYESDPGSLGINGRGLLKCQLESINGPDAWNSWMWAISLKDAK